MFTNEIKDKMNLILRFLDKGFETDLFEASINNLKDSCNPLRLNNFAYAIRGLIDIIFERIAPKHEILKCPWYKNETNVDKGVSWAQKCIYASQGNFTNETLRDSFKINVKKIHQRFIHARRDLNKLTHISEKYYDVSKDDIEKYSSELIEAMYDLFTVISSLKGLIYSHVNDYIIDTTIEEVINDTIQNIDHLSSHYYISDVEVTDIIVVDLIDKNIILQANGVIFCDLQWGSNSDIRNDIGHIESFKFDFKCEFKNSLQSPYDLELREDSFVVNNKTFEDALYGTDDNE
ncbi:MAG: hypothetical protein JW870_19110 [Candidatus Delongbacteria bacterium]|nr:hypothetical protein [Candidatus Delongbacteria bacterium]